MQDVSISIEHAIFSYFTQWLDAHAYLAWIVSHPLPSLGLLLLAIFSLWGLLKAVGRGIEQIWLFLLTTPFKLLQPILRLMWRSIQRGFGHTNFSGEQLESKPISSPHSERIERIIDRLQILSQEQENLLGELSKLMNSTTIKSQVKTRSDN
jgi:hypothetical protein